MKIHLLLLFVALLGGAPLAGAAEPIGGTPAALAPGSARQSTPGIEAAQALSTLTGVAISPLLGVSAVGAWKYFKTPSPKRAHLPWFAQPYFWIPGLLLILAVSVKDILGAGMPVALKRPFDILELFENKLSALVAAGAFVPLIAAIFGTAPSDSYGLVEGMGLALIDPSPVLNALTIPFAVALFLMVWLVAHVINVLILISPFGLVDAALKSARLLVLSILTGASLAHPYLGAALSILIIVVSYFLAGWAFRMGVFGTVFAWDLLTMRQSRFTPKSTANWMFTARTIDKVPVRTYGKLHRDEQGRLVLKYHPWLIWPARVLVLPAGEYALGRGLVYPELLHVQGGYAKAILDLPPRYRAHEAELAAIYKLAAVRDTGAIKGMKAIWQWFKELLGFRMRRLGSATSDQ